MFRLIKNFLFILLLTIYSCNSNSSDKFSFADKSYKIENVVFDNASAHIRISGTLTYPESQGHFPALVLIPGSGKVNRDGTDNDILRPLFEIADYFTRRGFAVLRCDRRGVGGSEGSLDFTTTIVDLSSDIECSIKYLENKQIIDKNRIGLIGHSLGGLIAAKVATDYSDLSYIVMLASPGLKQSEVLSQQILNISGCFGVNCNTANKFRVIIDSITIILNSKEDVKLKTEMINKMYKNQMSNITDKEIESLKKIGYVFQPNESNYAEMSMTPFWLEFFTLDPGSIIKQIKCPVLSLAGENDLQVSAEQNQTAIKTALETGNNNNYKLITFKGMNHLFQRCNSGSPDEYYKIKGTIKKSVLDSIYVWIEKQQKQI